MFVLESIILYISWMEKNNFRKGMLDAINNPNFKLGTNWDINELFTVKELLNQKKVDVCRKVSSIDKCIKEMKRLLKDK